MAGNNIEVLDINEKGDTTVMEKPFITSPAKKIHIL